MKMYVTQNNNGAVINVNMNPKKSINWSSCEKG